MAYALQQLKLVAGVLVLFLYLFVYVVVMVDFVVGLVLVEETLDGLILLVTVQFSEVLVGECGVCGF